MALQPDPASVKSFASARAKVLGEVEAACRRVHRDPAGVCLVAVSKTVPSARLVSAVAAGLMVLGENRVQEAEGKIETLAGEASSGREAGEGIRWHLVGHLQSNKAKRAIELFETIESVDSLELALRLDRLAGEAGRTQLPVYLQVNVDVDEAKAGFLPAGLEAEMPGLASLPHLRLDGLMTVGRLTGTAQEARPTFIRLRELSEKLRSTSAGATLGPGLSMGMTDDYPVAVEEGATVIRVGRAIFGDR